MLTMLSVLLPTLVAAFLLRDRLRHMAVRLLRHAATEEEIASHQRTEETQKAAIEALEARVGVLETRHAENAANIVQLKEQATARERALSHITRQRDQLLLRVRKLAARVLELEHQLAQLTKPADTPPSP